VVPHHTVKWRHAIPGAILAAVMLELVKWGMGAYLGSFQSYQKLYGTVAFVPILLLWIYLCWVSVLLGASLASSIAAFRYQPAELRLPTGYEIYGLLRLIGRFQQARAEGHSLDDDEILLLEPMLTDSLLQTMLCDLEAIRVVRRDERGEWLLARDLDKLTLSDLYETTQMRIPVREAYLPYRDDSLGQASVLALDALRLPLRELLKRRVSDIYSTPGDTP
jgi:membrane protein